MTFKKPLSPHIQIYKPQISSLTSIMHRATGMVLFISLIILCWSLTYYTYQIDVDVNSYEESSRCWCWLNGFMRFVLYFIGAGISFCLYYHLFNGIRHLFWDIGKGYDVKISNMNGSLIILLSLVATTLSVALVLIQI